MEILTIDWTNKKGEHNTKWMHSFSQHIVASPDVWFPPHSEALKMSSKKYFSAGSQKAVQIPFLMHRHWQIGRSSLKTHRYESQKQKHIAFSTFHLSVFQRHKMAHRPMNTFSQKAFCVLSVFDYGVGNTMTHSSTQHHMVCIIVNKHFLSFFLSFTIYLFICYFENILIYRENLSNIFFIWVSFLHLETENSSEQKQI